jgi:hypothetical protein
VAAALITVCAAGAADNADFTRTVQPLLKKYCYDCHGLGEKKGGMQFDDLSDNAVTGDLERWSKALKNVRAFRAANGQSARSMSEVLAQLVTKIAQRARTCQRMIQSPAKRNVWVGEKILVGREIAIDRRAPIQKQLIDRGGAIPP